MWAEIPVWTLERTMREVKSWSCTRVTDREGTRSVSIQTHHHNQFNHSHWTTFLFLFFFSFNDVVFRVLHTLRDQTQHSEGAVFARLRWLSEAGTLPVQRGRLRRRRGAKVGAKRRKLFFLCLCVCVRSCVWFIIFEIHQLCLSAPHRTSYSTCQDWICVWLHALCIPPSPPAIPQTDTSSGSLSECGNYHSRSS